MTELLSTPGIAAMARREDLWRTVFLKRAGEQSTFDKPSQDRGISKSAPRAIAALCGGTDFDNPCSLNEPSNDQLERTVEQSTFDKPSQDCGLSKPTPRAIAAFCGGADFDNPCSLQSNRQTGRHFKLCKGACKEGQIQRGVGNPSKSFAPVQTHHFKVVLVYPGEAI